MKVSNSYRNSIQVFQGPNGYDVAGSLSKQRVKNVRIYEK